VKLYYLPACRRRVLNARAYARRRDYLARQRAAQKILDEKSEKK